MTLEPHPFAVDELLKAFQFSPARRVHTRQGERLVSDAPIPPGIKGAFWESWKTDKVEWVERGYAIGKPAGVWMLTRWLNVDGSMTDHGKRKAEEARELAGINALPADWVPDDIKLESEQAGLLFDYQRPAAIRLKRALMGLTPPPGINETQAIIAGKNGNALDASDTGTGKTFVGLIAAHELGMTPCIVAPLAVLPSWKRAAKLLGVRLGWVINYDKIRTGRTELGKWAKPDPAGGDDYQKFEYLYLPGQRPLIIFDECQKCKSPDSKQGHLMLSAVNSGHKCLAISATAAKDPTEMRNLGALLGLHDGTKLAWRGWCFDNGCKETRGSMQYREKRQKQALEKLHRYIFPLKGSRLRVADIPEFPETQIVAEAMDTGNTTEISDAYDDLEKAIAKLAGDAELSGREKHAQTLAEIMKARIRAEKAKLDLFVSLAEEALEEDHSAVIFVNFRAHVAELADRLKTKCLIWGSDLAGRQQKPEERQANIDDFQADRSRVCVISLQAGGAGLSLHDLNGDYPRRAIISPSYSAIDLKQALGRVHRAGGKTKSMQQIIFAAGTIEEEICESIKAKLENIDTLNDGALAPPSILRHVSFDDLKQPELPGA